MAKPTDLPDDAIGALPYWSVIQQAAQHGWTTQQLWAGIRATSERYGNIGPGPTIRGVSRLRGLAGSIVAGSRQLAGAEDARRMLSSMVTRAPWARPMTQQRQRAQYQVRFEHVTEGGNGERVTQWRTLTGINRLPRTVGQLRELVEESGLSLADDYDQAHVGFGSIQVLSV